MSRVKIRSIKFHQPIMCRKHIVWTDNKDFDIELVDQLFIYVREKSSGTEAYSTIYNTAYFQIEEGAVVEKQRTAPTYCEEIPKVKPSKNLDAALDKLAKKVKK